MKKFHIVFILGLLLSGCSTSWHIRKAEQKCPECFKRDTIVENVIFNLDTIIKIDTTILVTLPKDTAKLDTTIVKLKPFSINPIHIENGVINVDVSLVKGNFKVYSYLDSAFYYRLQDSIRVKNEIITNYKQTIVNQSIIIEKNKTLKEQLKKWVKIGKYILIGLCSLFLSGLLYKFLKWIFNK